MTSIYRKPIAWSLIVTLTIVASVDEGLHYIPGFGHATQEGNRYLLLGISVPDDAAPVSSQTRITGKAGQDIPVYDEAECPICSASQERSLFGQVTSFESVASLVRDVPVLVSISAISTAVRSSQPRAPPIG